MTTAAIRWAGGALPHDVADSRAGVAADELESPTESKSPRWAPECVVANLLDEALRAEPDGGAVQVRVLPTATIEVIDHGLASRIGSRKNMRTFLTERQGRSGRWSWGVDFEETHRTDVRIDLRRSHAWRRRDIQD